MHSPSDADLLRMHADGDSDAFGHLYARHRERLHRVAWRIVGDEAEDALQDAMISAFRHAGRFRGHSAVSTWLHQIVVNAARDLARRKPLVAEADETMPSTVPPRSDNQQVMRWAGTVLSRGQQQAILLIDIYGYSSREAGQVLDVSPATVKSRAARGRARLAARLAT